MEINFPNEGFCLRDKLQKLISSGNCNPFLFVVLVLLGLGLSLQVSA